MATKRKPAKKRAASKRRPSRTRASDVPALFRLNIEVGDIEQAAGFYGELFATKGRRQAGSRCYFDCGAVTLQVVNVDRPHAAAKALYFTVKDLDSAFTRATALRCLSKERVHGDPGGEIVVRPWGERSFYVEDPWNNPLCFVEAGTIYPG
jgi:hypothetical protein